MVLEDWQRQWTLVHRVGVRSSSSSGGDRGCSTGSGSGSGDGEKKGLDDSLGLGGGGGGLGGSNGNDGLLEEEMDQIRSDEQCRRLLELIPLQSTKVRLWLIGFVLVWVGYVFLGVVRTRSRIPTFHFI